MGSWPGASPQARPGGAPSRRRKKLLAELEYARNSLAFFQPSLRYTDDARPAFVAQATAKIAELEQRLHQLGA